MAVTELIHVRAHASAMSGRDRKDLLAFIQKVMELAPPKKTQLAPVREDAAPIAA